MIEISTIIEMISFGSSTMFGILFLSNRFNNRKGNPFLGLFMISFGYFLLQGVLYDFYEKEMFQFDVVLFFLVLLLYYINKTIGNTVKKWHYLLFIPGVLMNITTNSTVLNRILFFHMLNDIFYLLTLLLIIYLFKILREHELNLKEFYSDTEKKTLSWLKTLIVIIFSFYSFEFVEGIILPTYNSDELESILSILYSIFPFSIVYLVGLNGFSQTQIFKNKLSKQKTKDELNKNSNQFDLETQSRFYQLEKTIVKEKLFTQQNLTLRDLSLSLNIKERNLSIMINSNTGDSFYAYINRLRIEEFKHLLTQPEYQKFSLFGLAQKVGFSSKSTFYKAFKEIENKTPKSYLVGLKSSSNLKRNHSI